MQLHEAALNYLGVKFRHQGRTRWGLDCVGLVALAALDADPDFTFTDLRAYGREPWKDNNLKKHLELHLGQPVDRGPEPDDVVLFYMGESQPSHVGIITPHPEGLGIVHSYANIGRVTHHRLDGSWRNRIAQVYSWHNRR